MIPAPANPPEPTRRYRRWADVLAGPAASPGVWWIVATYPDRTAAKDVVYTLRHGQRRPPAGDWDFAVRRQPDGSHALYAYRHAPAPPAVTGRILAAVDHGSFT